MRGKRFSKQERHEKHPRLISGIISITSRGVGYVSHSALREDIEIQPYNLNTALNSDTVEVSIHKKAPRRRVQGKVTRVIERAKHQFVGTLKREETGWILVPDDKRMYRPISIPLLKTEQLSEGAKALVHLAAWENPQKRPLGKVIRVLGQAGEHKVEMEAIALERGFDAGFPAQVVAEAAEIKRHRTINTTEIKNRRDFRGIPTFTIDPEDAKDFDDAISIQFQGGGDIEVGVHIADVSHYVRPGSAIDTEAKHRGTSVYLPHETIPMLPEVLSNDVCSLTPESDKLAYSIVFTLSKDAVVKDQWIGETIIHSQKRFSYEEAQNTLTAKEGLYAKELQALDTLAEKLRTKRMKEGSLSFDQDEVKFKLDQHGVPLEIFLKQRLATNLLIEDFMLLANRRVAEHFYKLSRAKNRDALFVYRIHDVPDQEKIEELQVFLHAVGFSLKITGGIVSGQEINRLFKEIEGKPEENLIKTATIRSMAKAVYSTKNIGHFGLAFRYYTHFTSPIRRYPDMMVHRILKKHLAQDTEISTEELSRYEELAIHSSQREAAAVEAEREAIKYKQVEFLQHHIGETFEGVVSGVTDWGIYVEERKTKAEGMIRLRSLVDDFYVLDKKHFRLVGEKTKKTYALGDRIVVTLTAANLETKTLEFLPRRYG